MISHDVFLKQTCAENHATDPNFLKHKRVASGIDWFQTYPKSPFSFENTMVSGNPQHPNLHFIIGISPGHNALEKM